jgi:hypothetical protein
MKKIKFFDENTKKWWIPVTGYVWLLSLYLYLYLYLCFFEKINYYLSSHIIF